MVNYIGIKLTDLSIDKKIWRYISLERFKDIVNTSSLYFASPSEQQDKWECHPPKAFRTKHVWEKRFQDNKYMRDVDQNTLAENTVAYFEAARKNSDIYGFSCWSKSEGDNPDLWGSFTDSESAVAISTTPRKLIMSVIDEPLQNLGKSEIAGKYPNRESKSHMLIGCVNYVELDSEEFPETKGQIYLFSQGGEPYGTNSGHADIIVPYLYKRKQFSFEDEVRVVFYKSHKGSALYNVKRINFDPKKFIIDVMIAPLANSRVEKEIHY